MYKNNNKNRKRTQTQRPKRKNQQIMPFSNNLNRNSAFPLNKVVTMTCVSGPIVVQNPAASFVVLDFITNDVFSGVPGVATPNCKYYDSYALAYNRTKVLSFSVKYTVVSNEPATSVDFGIFFSDNQPSVTKNTRQLCVDAVENAGSTGLQSVGQTVGSSKFISGVYKFLPGALTDPDVYNGDADFSANTGTTPSQKIWMGFVLMLGSAGLVANGAIVNFECRFKTKYTSLKN